MNEAKQQQRDRVTKILLQSVFTLFVLLAMLCAPHVARAEGSVDLTENGGKRPYTEWSNKKTSAMERKQIIYIYAQAGETLYFGSSEVNGCDGQDIVMTYTDANGQAQSKTFDNQANKTGHIQTREMETAGPKQLNNDKGYNAHEYTVKQSGVYQFEFHSSDPNKDNPIPAAANGQWSTQNASVAAWDITVVNGEGQPVTGRVYADYLAMNMGDKNQALNSQVYVVTHDGYQYLTDFNGMDPYGFLFFGNNRGLMKDERSTYYSVKAPVNGFEMGDLPDDVSYYNPTKEDDDKNKTFKIFFNKPAEDMPTDIVPEKKEPVQLQDGVKFIGHPEYADNKGITGWGGEFVFTLPEGQDYGSFQIEIQCDPNDLTNVVYLANPCVAGENRIYWDGKDANGNIVPAGNYKARVVSKGGEYHFLFFDVENNVNGVVNKLLNPPANSNADPYWVYYNNNKNTQNSVGDQENHLTGVSSKDGASKFSGGKGDNAAIDLWTYSEGSTFEMTFRLEDKKVETGRIRGFVFEDENVDGHYKQLDNDKPFGGLEVKVYKAEDNITPVYSGITDSNGYYSTGELAYGDYRVEITGPGGEYYLSTPATNPQTVRLSAENASSGKNAQDVGYAKNQQTAIDVYFTKVDEQSQTITGKSAVFELRKDNQLIETITMDASGVFTINGLEVGTYTLVETQAPEGYRNDNPSWSIVVSKSEVSKQLQVSVSQMPEGEETTSITVILSPDFTYHLVNRAIPNDLKAIYHWGNCGNVHRRDEVIKGDDNNEWNFGDYTTSEALNKTVNGKNLYPGDQPPQTELQAEGETTVYIFTGWVDKDGKPVDGNTTMGLENLDVYATWRTEQVITLEKQLVKDGDETNKTINDVNKRDFFIQISGTPDYDPSLKIDKAFKLKAGDKTSFRLPPGKYTLKETKLTGYRLADVKDTGNSSITFTNREVNNYYIYYDFEVKESDTGITITVINAYKGGGSSYTTDNVITNEKLKNNP